MANSSTSEGLMSFDIDGAGATDTMALRYSSPAAGVGFQGSAIFVVSGLTAASHTFTAKYRTSNGVTTELFNYRSIIVIPLP